MARINSFWRCESGNASVLFAVSAIPLLALAGGGVDLAKQGRYDTAIQTALDGAALAAARNIADQTMERGASDVSYDFAESEARTLFDEQMARLGIQVEMSFEHSARSVITQAEWEMPTSFLPLIGIDTLAVRGLAEAGTREVVETCVYVTAPVEQGVTLSASSDFRADCNVWVESSNRAAIEATASSDMEAADICANGATVLRATSTVSPEPEPCARAFRDPLAHVDVPAEAESTCEFTNLVVKGHRTLQPGVYCGRTYIAPASDVQLEAGEYVFRDGLLEIGSGSDLAGDNVLLYFSGEASGLLVGNGAGFEGRGRIDGDFAGLLLYVDRDCDTCEITLEPGGTASIEGTVYALNAPLTIQSHASTLAAPSALLIVYQLAMRSAASFEIGTNFDAGTVPAAYSDAVMVRLVR